MDGASDERAVVLARREAEVMLREAVLVGREAEVSGRESAILRRRVAGVAILAAADERDHRADLRDAAAERRENELDLARMLADRDDFVYGDDWGMRRAAGIDRLHSKEDREASRADRISLFEGPGDASD